MSEKRECQGCGADLSGTHKKRKWCSEGCRRQTLYSGTCKHCGASTNGYHGPGTASDACIDCSRERNKERNERLVEMWEAGGPTWYIAERLGMSEKAVTAWISMDRRRNSGKHSLRRLGGNARERWKQMIAWRKAGKRNAEIAELLGTTEASVRTMFNTARKAGFEFPNQPKLRQEPRERTESGARLRASTSKEVAMDPRGNIYEGTEEKPVKPEDAARLDGYLRG